MEIFTQCLDKKTNPKGFEPYRNDHEPYSFDLPRLSKKQVDMPQSDIRINTDCLQKRILEKTDFISDRSIEHADTPLEKIYIEGEK